LIERTPVNNQIRASDVRVVDEDGKNIGILPLEKALALAREKGTDLVLVSAKAVPPIAKTIDYGKYQYEQKKKEKAASKGHRTETKSLQIKLATGEHDLELKSKKASTFLEEGHRVKVELFLSGRAKYLKEDFLKERLNRILRLITTEYKIADGPKRGPKGLGVVLERSGKKDNENEQIIEKKI